MEKVEIMPSGKYAGVKISELESTYIVYSLEKTNMVDDLREAMLDELYKRFFQD